MSVFLFIVSVLIVFLLWYANKAWDKLWSDVAYKTRYIECDPNELFAELEKTFQIKIPQQIWEIKTARNYGSWDSKSSCYIVKFCAEPNTVEVFLSSFPKEVDLVPYTKKKDFRYVQTKRHLAPSWFTESINGGKIGNTSGNYEIYIDTSVGQRYVVYLWGFGDLPVPDTNSRAGNEVSSQFNKK